MINVGFKDLFKPKWKHSSYSIRLEAVKCLTDEEILKEVVETDDDRNIRTYALENPYLKDQNFLAKYAKEYCSISNNSIQMSAMENPNLTDNNILLDIAKNGGCGVAQKMAIERITDNNIIMELANDKNFLYRDYAVSEINDKSILENFAKNDSNESVRESAIRTLRNKFPSSLITEEELNDITDEDKLIDIAKNSIDAKIRCLAVRKIQDEEALIYILKTDIDDDVQEEVVKNDNLINQKVLCEVANDIKHEKYGYKVRLNVIPKIKDDETLSNVVLNEHEEQLIYLAVSNPNLTNKDALNHIANSNIVWHTRNDYDRDIYYELAPIAKSRLERLNE